MARQGKRIRNLGINCERQLIYRHLCLSYKMFVWIREMKNSSADLNLKAWGNWRKDKKKMIHFLCKNWIIIFFLFYFIFTESFFFV